VQCLLGVRHDEPARATDGSSTAQVRNPPHKPLAAEATFTTGVDHRISGGAELAYGRKTRRR
jgi:hypothetical protein